MVDNCHGLCHLSNIPVRFGNLGWVTPLTSRSLNNNKFPCYALQVLQFSWAVYSFQGGHLALTIQSRNLPFMSRWLATPLIRDTPYFRNSRHAAKSLVLQMICSITFGHRGTLPSSMDT
jgi:hypothetical protein